MKLPDKDDPGGDREGALPLADVLEVLKRHGVSVDPPDAAADAPVTLTSDDVCEVHFLADPVGGLMVRNLARRFGVDLVQFYYFRQLEEQARAPTKH